MPDPTWRPSGQRRRPQTPQSRKDARNRSDKPGAGGSFSFRGATVRSKIRANSRSFSDHGVGLDRPGIAGDPALSAFDYLVIAYVTYGVPPLGE